MATVAPSRPRAGRNAEAALLVLALAVGIGAYVIVGLNIDGRPPADLPQYAATLGGLALLMHLALRWRAPDADPVLLPVVTTLNGVGLAMIFRIDDALALRGRPAGFGERQLLWTIVGLGIAIAVILILRDHRTLRRWPFLAMVAGLVALLLPMLPVIGRTINGARLWVHIGPLNFQPAELAKILLAVFFAGYFVTRRDALTLAGSKLLGLRLPRFADLAPIVVVWAASVAVLVLQRDLGTSLLFFGLFVSMLYVATERVSWIAIGMVLVGVGIGFAYTTFGYVRARFDVWLNALDPDIYNRDPGGSGQLVGGLFGLASGGLTGTGLGEGHPELVPFANSDFIIASLGEELGLTGLLAILMLYVVLAQRGLRAALGVRDGFGKLLAAGLSFVIAFQCFVVVGGVTRLIPLTGLTMPFLAAGGSSLVANWIIVALLLRISDAARRPAPAGAGSVVGSETAQFALAELTGAAAGGPLARFRRRPAPLAAGPSSDDPYPDDDAHPTEWVPTSRSFPATDDQTSSRPTPLASQDAAGDGPAAAPGSSSPSADGPRRTAEGGTGPGGPSADDDGSGDQTQVVKP